MLYLIITPFNIKSYSILLQRFTIKPEQRIELNQRAVYYSI